MQITSGERPGRTIPVQKMPHQVHSSVAHMAFQSQASVPSMVDDSLVVVMRGAGETNLRLNRTFHRIGEEMV